MLSGLVSGAAAAVDRMVAAAVVRRSLRAAGAAPGGRRWSMGSTKDRSVDDVYDREEHFADPSVFFGEPACAKPVLSAVRAMGGEGQVVDAAWRSGEPFHEGVAELYLSRAANRTASARLFLHHERAEAAVILVHGYLGGRYAFEERVWPIRSWFARGLDVALLTLPFHGVRADGHARPPLFPAADPRLTNEGLRQTIGDLRALMRWFHARGTARIGAMGMSLGGYAVALLATLEPTLDFAVPVVPLADVTAFARGDLPSDAIAHARAHRVVSPLARASRISRDRVLVIGADRDGIAPLNHARALARHFDAPLATFAGGHVLQLGRADAFVEIDRLLERSVA